jgi:hypothetical protein
MPNAGDFALKGGRLWLSWKHHNRRRVNGALLSMKTRSPIRWMSTLGRETQRHVSTPTKEL